MPVWYAWWTLNRLRWEVAEVKAEVMVWQRGEWWCFSWLLDWLTVLFCLHLYQALGLQVPPQNRRYLEP